jgi:hypothetical protein
LIRHGDDGLLVFVCSFYAIEKGAGKKGARLHQNVSDRWLFVFICPDMKVLIRSKNQ